MERKAEREREKHVEKNASVVRAVLRRPSNEFTLLYNTSVPYTVKQLDWRFERK